MPLRKKFDAVVVGGGPAGSAAAMALSHRGYSVVLIERSEYATTRVGETLPPAIRKLLVSLGVWDEFVSGNHSPSFGIRSAWGTHDVYENDFIFNPYGPGWHVDRNRFDRMMTLAAENAGVKIFSGVKVVSLTRTKSCGWEITLLDDHRRTGLVAEFLVDATGRRASFARKQGARRISYDHLIGLVGFLSPKFSETLDVDDSFTLVESQRDGWWYSAILPDNRLVAAYMTDVDLCPSDHSRTDFWREQLQKAHHTSSRAKDYSLRSTLTTFAANSSRLEPIIGQNWLAAGDSAASYDPLSAQGVYKALESGLRAADAIGSHGAGQKTALRDFAAAIRHEFDGYLLKRNKYYDRERHWLNSIFWQRRKGVGVL